MTVKKEKPVLDTQNIKKLEAILSTMKYGSVTIYMQDKKIVQIEKTEKYDVYDCFFLKDNACNDKASNMEGPWDLPIDDERVLIIDKFHYFIRAVLENKLPLQEYVLKFMQFAEENPPLFAPVPMVCKVNKQQPITNAQKGYLNDLLKYHTIKCNVQIDSLTKSEASRLIDGIILQYGRIMH